MTRSRYWDAAKTQPSNRTNNVWLSAGSRKCSSTCSRSVFSVDATQASKWSNETGQWRNTQTTALMSPAHKLRCCSEVPFQHVPFFGRWWRRMLRPRGHRGPCGPRLERVTANEWLCHGYLHTAPCGFEKMARKKPLDLLSSDMSSTAAPRQRGRLSWTPSSLSPALALTVSPPSPPPGEYTLYLYFWLLPGLWFKYTCVAPSAPHKVGENVILIQRGNSQCNHREYAINWESLQSIARRVYSYTSFAVFSSLRTLALLQLPPFYFSSVLFSFAKCRLPLAALCAPPSLSPQPSSSVEKAPSSLTITPRLTNSSLFNHISSSPTIITASPSLPCTPFPFTVFFLSCNSPHAHTAFIIIIPPSYQSAYSLHLRSLSASLSW